MKGIYRNKNRRFSTSHSRSHTVNSKSQSYHASITPQYHAGHFDDKTDSITMNSLSNMNTMNTINTMNTCSKLDQWRHMAFKTPRSGLEDESVCIYSIIQYA